MIAEKLSRGCDFEEKSLNLFEYKALHHKYQTVEIWERKQEAPGKLTPEWLAAPTEQEIRNRDRHS